MLSTGKLPKARQIKAALVDAIASIASPQKAVRQLLFWGAKAAHVPKVNPCLEALIVYWSQEVMARVAGRKCCAIEGCQLQTPGYLCSFHGWLLSVASYTRHRTACPSSYLRKFRSLYHRVIIKVVKFGSRFCWHCRHSDCTLASA